MTSQKIPPMLGKYFEIGATKKNPTYVHMGKKQDRWEKLGDGETISVARLTFPFYIRK